MSEEKVLTLRGKKAVWAPAPAGVGGGVQTVEFVMDASSGAPTSALTGNEIIELAAKQPIIGRVSMEGQSAENTASTFLFFDGVLLRMASSSTIYAAFSVTLLDGSVLTKQYYLVPLDGTAVEVYVYPIAKSEN